MYYPNRPKYPKEQLYELFEDKIVDIYRIQRRRDGILELLYINLHPFI